MEIGWRVVADEAFDEWVRWENPSDEQASAFWQWLATLVDAGVFIDQTDDDYLRLPGEEDSIVANHPRLGLRIAITVNFFEEKITVTRIEPWSRR